MTHDDHDDGLTNESGRYLISDRELDALADAELAFERWGRTARWWATGSLEDPGACDAA